MNSEDDFHHKTQCDICKRNLDFGNINEVKNDVLMINYYNPLINGICLVITCSTKCKEKFNELTIKILNPPGCIVCGSICFTTKWNFDVKFINLGGWISTKYMCSEKCRKEFHKEVKKDEELEAHYQCKFCNKLSKTNIKKCSRCKITYYCDEKCQKSDWKDHKLYCKS